MTKFITNPLSLSEDQIEFFTQAIRASNFIYNETIEEYVNAYKEKELVFVSELYKYLIVDSLGDSEREWILNTPIDILLNAVIDAKTDRKRYINLHQEQKNGPSMIFPTRKLTGTQNIRLTRDSFSFSFPKNERDLPYKLYVEGIEPIALNWKHPISRNTKEIIIRLTPGNRWSVAVADNSRNISHQ